MPDEKKNQRHTTRKADLFTCDFWDCRMPKADCLKRQDQRASSFKNYWGSKTQPAFPECQGCLQGMKIRMDKMMGENRFQIQASESSKT